MNETQDRWTNDHERRTYNIEAVSPLGDSGWQVTFDGGWCFIIPTDSPITPEVGMEITQFGEGFGRPVRGVLLDGQCVFYRTAQEEEQRHAEWVADQKCERREQFERDRPELDRRYAALPECFRDRIDRFRRNNPEFREEFESYELFTCEEAVLIADAIGTPEGIADFSGKSWAEQKAQVPALSDDHSGNTFGMACRLAIDYVTDQERVRKRHGALAPLVGSEEYGCVPRKGANECK